MPRNKPIESLFQLCLDNVTDNMDQVWCKHYVETYTKENKFYLYVLGPFDCLPSKVIVEIINLLKKEKRLKKHYVDLLVTHQLQALDLSRETDEIGYPLRLASIRCANLKILNVSGCPKISKQVYQEHLPQLEKLQVLDISNTSSGDACLYILGAYCRDLRELNATSCPITDSGIKGLCVSKDDLGQMSDRLGQCKAITKLLIEYTKVSKCGIQAALENLPNLKVLSCCSSVQVLSSMHQEALPFMKVGDVPRYPLIDLHCTNETLESPYSPGALSTAVSLCPYLMKLRLVTQETLLDEDLLCLMSCERLRELSIGGGEACHITFDGGIWPVLQAVGQTLDSLTLAEIPSVNLRAIIQFCPNVRTLLLFMNHSYSLAWPEEERNPFSPRKEPSLPTLNKLESVHLVCVSHLYDTSVIPSESLPLLLSSPSLRHLYAKDCGTLTDAVFQKLFDTHRFQSVEHIELEQCNSITKRSIDLLLNPGNPLRILKLWECQSLTRQNATDWQKKAKKKKWDLTIDWS